MSYLRFRATKFIYRVTVIIKFILDMVNLAQVCFTNSKKEIERIYFPSGIYSGLPLPDEDLDEEKKIYTDFENRFTISVATLAIAIVEYELNSRNWINHPSLYLEAAKNVIFNNILKLRETIIMTSQSRELYIMYDSPFFSDEEPSYLTSPNAKERYMTLVSHKAVQIENFIAGNGDFENLYYHFYPALGELLPNVSHPGNNQDVINFINKNINGTITLFDIAYQDWDKP